MTTSANFNEVQNENELTDEGVKGDSISSTLGGKRPAPSAAEGSSSEDEVSPATASADCNSALPQSPCAVMNYVGRKRSREVSAIQNDLSLCALQLW